MKANGAIMIKADEEIYLCQIGDIFNVCLLFGNKNVYLKSTGLYVYLKSTGLYSTVSFRLKLQI
jgi:hypothetical protein